MQWIPAIGGGAFVLACLAVGLRLLLLACRTRKLPETAMGISLFVMGGISYPLTATARAAVALPLETRANLAFVSHLGSILGIALLGIFVWRVFRPDARGRAGALTLALAITGCVVWQGISPGFEAGAVSTSGGGLACISLVSAGGLLWAAVESAQLAARLRRQAALGLAAPHLALMVRRWTTAIAAAGVLALAAFGMHMLDIDPATSIQAGLLIGPLGLLAATQLWLAFFRRPEPAATASASV
jgi:hypothetical protein